MLKAVFIIIIIITLIVISYVIGYLNCKLILAREINKEHRVAEKNIQLYRLICKWHIEYKNGRNIYQLLKNKGYKNCAIYGVGALGQLIIQEAGMCKDVNISYAIDRNAKKINSNITVFSPEDELPTVDVIIITTFTEYYSVIDTLQKKNNIPMISVDELIYEL